MFSFLKKIIGSRNDRLLKKYGKLVSQVNSLEPKIAALSNLELSAKTQEYRASYQEGVSLEKLLPEAFSVVRESSKRILGMRHFEVQILGGVALHFGHIAEMRTGEGKTLVATLPAYLNALSGKEVYVVTVNDYLARRDAEWMGKLYKFLGMTTGVISAQQSKEEKSLAYNADIIYGTNNEFGFDYLRDNMEHCSENRRQRTLSYAIIDEIDSILIDESRTPLVISGQAEDHTDMYTHMNGVPSMLKCMDSHPRPNEPEPEGDFWIDEKTQQVYLSEKGHKNVEGILVCLGLLPKEESLYHPRHISLMQHLILALRAHNLFFRDQQYVVQNNQVIIVDEFTGRLMVGRRWSDGLHQAIEAKEGVKIQLENQTLASITLQNYFRMYTKLAGMTGTADTEAQEFQEIYGLETIIIPSNRPTVRKDQNDQIFKTKDEKFTSIVNDIRKCHHLGQPVLVGTTSIENSEVLSRLLKKAKLPHEVLNAKHHAREAEIIAEAGKPSQITIATNMAGRGTDIVLGGNIEKQISCVQGNMSFDEVKKENIAKKIRAEWNLLNDKVKKAGGLRVIGTERHESRRIDNQLRGRAGRQGDPGSSRFYLSLEDSLMRIFAGDRVRNFMKHLRIPRNEPIEAGIVSRSIETAQKRVESRNFDIRKEILEYDNVANEQRKILYAQRNAVLDSNSVSRIFSELCDVAIAEVVETYIPLKSIKEQWDEVALQNVLELDWCTRIPLVETLRNNNKMTSKSVLKYVLETVRMCYQEKVSKSKKKDWNSFERSIMLQVIDQRWREHLSNLEYLRQGIHLRGYAQKNPKQEYKREAFELFSNMLSHIRNDISRFLMNAQEPETLPQSRSPLVRSHQSQSSSKESSGLQLTCKKDLNIIHSTTKIGRNHLCPCNSGRKYKYCHGKLG